MEYTIVNPNIKEIVGRMFIQPIRQWGEPGWNVTLEAQYVYEIVVTPNNVRYVVPRLQQISKVMIQPTKDNGKPCDCDECLKIHGKNRVPKVKTEIINEFEAKGATGL